MQEHKDDSIQPVAISAIGNMRARCAEYHEHLLFSGVLAIAPRANLLNTCRTIRKFLGRQEVGDYNPMEWQILALKRIQK